MKTKSLHFIVPVVAVFFLSVSVLASGDEKKTGISSFRDYEWKTSFDEIFQSEITQAMIEGADYDMGDADYQKNFIQIKNGSVGGYDASVDYIFSESGLITAGYELDLIGADEVTDIINKYESVYGDAVIIKIYTPGKTCAVWVDEQGNKILLDLNEEEDVDPEEKSDAIIYFEHDSDFWDLYAKSLKHSIDLDKELNKIGNTDGI